MTRAWQFDEHRDFGWSQAESPEDYERIMRPDPAAQRELLLALGLRPEHTFVDLGCGGGSLAIAAARICRRSIGVDVSASMLDYARRQAEAAGVVNIEFIDAGFLTYEHTGAPADVVVSQRALHHLPDFWKAIALRRIAVMMPPGGVFFLQDIVYSFAPADADAAIAAWIAAVAREDGSGFPRSFFEEHVREEWSTYTWILERMLRDAGFEITASEFRRQAYADYTCVKR